MQGKGRNKKKSSDLKSTTKERKPDSENWCDGAHELIFHQWSETFKMIFTMLQFYAYTQSDSPQLI